MDRPEGAGVSCCMVIPPDDAAADGAGTEPMAMVLSDACC